MQKFHKVITETIDKKSGNIIQVKTENFFSIYNAERRILDIEEDIFNQKKQQGRERIVRLEKMAA